ncbi:MAG: sigma-70 family RNA polymerase sigma factor [Saprospiraceae bacterium]|nr:sigma-70 family RNA polymerase sigma factor [Saprospiraceae bacterium]
MTQRNRALKSLYMDEVVNGKIISMISDYNSKADPDDVLQEGVILLDEMIRTDKFRGDSKVRSFLIGICKNIIRNDLRSSRKVVLKEEIAEHDREDADTPEDRMMVEEQSDLEKKRDQLLKECLGALTENCREVLGLYYYQSYKMAQIADERGLKNAHQAKKAVDRCRQQLRTLITAKPALANFLKQWT